MSKCELCGEPMPDGEKMFKFHGYSGPCPKPPLPPKETELDRMKVDAARYRWLRRQPWVKAPGLHAWGAELDKAIDASRNDTPDMPANAESNGALAHPTRTPSYRAGTNDGEQT